MLIYIYSTMKTEDTEALKKQSAKLCKIKAGYSQPTCKNCSGTLLAPLCTILIVRYTVTQFIFQYSPSTSPTLHLRW